MCQCRKGKITVWLNQIPPITASKTWNSIWKKKIPCWWMWSEVSVYTEPQQLIDPKKLIKFLQEVDEEYAKTYGEHCIVRVIMNKVSV
jgi:hypothetical protein